MPSWLDLLMGGQAPILAGPPDQNAPSPPAPGFSQALAAALANLGTNAGGSAFGGMEPGAGQYFSHLAQAPIAAAMYPGQVAQAGYAGNVPSPQEMVPGATNMAMQMLGAGSLLAPSGALGAAGGRLPLTQRQIETIANRAEAGPRPIAPIVTAEGLPAMKSGRVGVKGDEPVAGFSEAAKQAKAEVEAAGKGAGPMDLSGNLVIPNVPQTPLQRYIPPRGVSDRLTDALNNPDVVNGVSEGIQRGIDMGAHKWYHTNPIREAFAEAYKGSNSDPGGAKAFGQFMDLVAATSPRSDVPTNIRNATYYFGLQQRGEPVPQNIPYPYGHIAQGQHLTNYNELNAAVNPGWDVLLHPKPPSYSQNLQGNFTPVAGDTHAFRAVGMRTGDPRFLETQVSAVVKPGERDPTKQTLIDKYGDITTNEKGQEIVTFRPQKLFNDGNITMEEAQKIPMFWAAAPRKNEYDALEKFYQMLAQRHGLDPAGTQAAGWAGSGQLTGLGTPPDKTFAEMMNERALYTSKIRGEDPKQTLFDALRGIKPLLSTIPIAAAPIFARKDQDQQQ